MLDWLGQSYFQNTVLEWLIAASVAVGTSVVTLLVRWILRRRFTARTPLRETGWRGLFGHLVRRTKWFLLIGLALAAGAHTLTVPERGLAWINRMAVLFVLIQIGVWGGTLVDFYLERRHRALLAEEANAAATSTVGAIRVVLKTIVWSVVLLVALDNFGVNVTALVAGLGIGGIAIGLALQNVLGDLFASISIVLDKPFGVGDFIVVGEFMGNVENIGIKSTRLRSLGGEQLVFSNNDLLNSRIRNYFRMDERRILFTVGVIYQTSTEDLEAIPGLLREAVEAAEATRFDRAHLARFGPSSFDFEVVYYVLSRDYNIYMDVNEAIHFHIVRSFRERGIEFAYPTRTLYMTTEQPLRMAWEPGPGPGGGSAGAA